MRFLWFPASAFVLSALTGCSTYRDDLARSQRAFEDNSHETALAILRMLEPDTSHLSEGERARYAYLRGMTDFRIGYKADARHWLAVAKALDEKTPGDIPSQWRKRLDQSLAELDGQVWASGMETLPLAPAAANDRPTHKHPSKVRQAPEPSTEEEEEEAQPPSRAPKKAPLPDEDE